MRYPDCVAEDSKPVFIRLRNRSGPLAGQWVVPEELRPRLVADAEEQGSSMNRVAVEILAAAFKFPLESAGTPKRSAPSSDAEELNLRLPAALYLVIDMARAAAGENSVQDVIKPVLCAHYGLRYVKPVPVARRRAA